MERFQNTIKFGFSHVLCCQSVQALNEEFSSCFIWMVITETSHIQAGLGYNHKDMSSLAWLICYFVASFCFMSSYFTLAFGFNFSSAKTKQCWYAIICFWANQWHCVVLSRVNVSLAYQFECDIIRIVIFSIIQHKFCQIELTISSPKAHQNPPTPTTMTAAKKNINCQNNVIMFMPCPVRIIFLLLKTK